MTIEIPDPTVSPTMATFASPTFATSGPSFALCAGVIFDLAISASLAALLILLVSAPFNALARLSASSFSFIFRSCSSREPSLSVTFFKPFVKTSISELGDIDVGVGDCDTAGRGTGCRIGGSGWRLKVATGETGALAGMALVVTLDLGGTRVLFIWISAGAVGLIGGGCMPFVVVAICGTGGISLVFSVAVVLIVLAILERLLERLACAGAAAGAGSTDNGKSAIVLRRSARAISSGFSR
jgi:hypothetical protein